VDEFASSIAKASGYANEGRLRGLAGTWTGHVISSFDEHQCQHEVRLTILQSWTGIRMCLRTQQSESHSLLATILTEYPEGPLLSYEYLNEPKATAGATLHPHRGTARLTMRKDGWHLVLDGDYYTGRGRQNYGVLYLTRCK
jgi:hypothetical protein